MKSVLSVMSDQSKNYLSPLEKKLNEAFMAWGLSPEVNYPVGYFYIDLAFLEQKLALEVDGKDYHSSYDQHERDAFRQKKLEEKGWHFERFDGWFVNRHADVIVAKIILRYFTDKVDTRTKKRAIAVLGAFFRKNNQSDLAEALLKESIKDLD